MKINQKLVQVFNLLVTLAMLVITALGSFQNGWFTLANLVSWLGLIGTVGLAHAKEWNFPFNMAQNLFAAVQGYKSKLFGDMFMNIFYFLSQIYGISNWRRNKTSDGSLKIVQESNWLLVLLAVVFGGFVLGFVSYLMGGQQIFWDAFNNSTAIVAQILQMRRNKGSWLLWLLTNAIGVLIWFRVGEPQMAIMYFVFCLNAVRGWINWSLGAGEENAAASES